MGQPDDGTTDDGTANATDVWTAAGKCTAGTVSGVYRKRSGGITDRKTLI